MQIKKRARSATFGKKKELVEVKSEEQVNQTQEAVKAEVAVGEENKGEKTQNASAEKKTEEAVVKKDSEQITETAQASAMQNQEAVGESLVNKVTDRDAPVNENSFKEETQTAVSQSQAIPSEPPVSDSNYVIQTEVKKNMIRYFIIIAVISFFVGLVSMAAVNLFLQKTPFALPFTARKVEITPKSKPTITVVPTKVKEVNLAEFDIEILNGSGIIGEAARLKTVLTTGGFEVISTGNADKSDYTNTIISVKKKVSSTYVEKLKSELKKKYTLGSDAKIFIPESSEADVIITIGSNTAQN